MPLITSPPVIDLHKKIAAVFRQRTPLGQTLFALDWQHAAYHYDPHTAFDAADNKVVTLPIFPDGDYYIVLSTDFTVGTFGHPWAQTICVFGQPLLDALAIDPPLLFNKIMRRNGLPVI